MAINVPADRTTQVNPLQAPRLPEIATGPTPDAGGAAAAEESGALQQTAGDIHEYAATQQQNANEMALTNLDIQASQAQTQIETKVRQMHGQDALGASDYADDAWEKTQNDLKAKAANNQQLMGLQKLLAQRESNIDNIVKTHTSQEITKFDNDQSETALQAYADEAVHNYGDPDRIEEAKDKQDATIEMLGRRQGWSDLQIQQKKADTASLTNTAIVMRMLDHGDYDSAKDYYDDNKDGFNSKDQITVDRNMEEGRIRSLGMSTWQDVQGLKLPDGNPDEAAQEKAVMDNDDLNDEEKEKVTAYVKLKANTAKVDLAMQQRANDRAFLDNVIQARQKGLSLEAVLPMARKSATDTYDQALKEQQIQQIYAPPQIKTDPTFKNAMLDGIDAGTVDKAQIQNAFDKKIIDGSFYDQAMSKYRSNVIEGNSPAQQRVNEQLKQMAKTQFGSDTNSAASWLSEMKSQGFEKPPEEQVKIATDSLKQDSSTTSRFWNWIPVVGGETIPGTGTPQFQTDIQKRTNDQLMTGQLQKDLGPETVKAISVGNQVSGNGQTAPQTIQDLSVSVGGYDNLKPGKPAYNAMQSLMKAGKVVSVQSVQAVLQHYPDGNFSVDNTPPTGNRVGRLPRVRK